MATAKSVISTIGSVAAGAMVARTIINDFLPPDIHDYLFSAVRSFFSRRFSNELTLIINEYDGLETNQIFEAAELYLGTLTKSSLSSTASSAHRLRVTKPESEKSIHVSVDQNEEVVDEFQGVKFTWVLQCHHVEGPNGHGMNSMRHEVRAFYLTFHKKDNNKGLALDKYLPYVLDRAALLKQENKTIKLFTVEFNCRYGAPADAWSSVKLNHPATFETLALEPELKNMIIDDLDRFVKRKEYYRRVGKAWKRGYLLYGPPGTGKSSLIAAMANYLNFDIYDLELSAVTSDSDLRKILVGTGNRSIVVVEDIDCSVDFKDRELPKDTEEGNNNDAHYNNNNNRRVTLSGLLNFIDGLWSSCGDERIIIFTTNHKEKLDPALLRPGRMDMHIHMSYCTASGFNVLARNYLRVKSDNNPQVFEEIERLIEEAQVSPAEVAEQLIKHDEPNDALGGLVDFFKLKISQNALVIKDRPNDGVGIVKESNESKLEGESICQSVKNL